MAGWSKVQSANATESAGAVAPSLAGVTAGNLLTVQLAYYRGSSSSTTPPAAPSGWTQLTPTNNAISPGGTDSFGVAIYARANAPSGTNTPSFTINTGTGISRATICEWSYNSAAPLGTLDQMAHSESVVSTQSRASGTTAALADVIDLALIAMAFFTTGGVTNAAITDPPSGYTSLFVKDNTLTSAIGIEFAFQALASSAAQSTSWSWTDSSTAASAGAIACLLAAAPFLPNTWLQSQTNALLVQ